MHQRFSGWRAARNVYIYRDDSIHAAYHIIAIMIIASPVRACAHANHPFGVWHLVVALSDCRCHFIRYRSGNDHDVCLPRRGSEYDTKTILVVSRHRNVHHFDTATRQREGERPQRPLSGPIDDLICLGACKLSVHMLIIWYGDYTERSPRRPSSLIPWTAPIHRCLL